MRSGFPWARVALLAAATSGGMVAAQTRPHLRDLVSGGFRIGYASRSNFWTLPDAAQYQDTARAEFNILTPEDQLKWDTVHPGETTYNFAPADRHLTFARENGMAFHGHTLVWHRQNPAWLTGRTWTATALTTVLHDHIDTVMGHFQGQVLVWDVVNEAFNEDGSYRSSIWSDTLGTPYVELAFRRARGADPAARLIYNDFNVETLGAKSNALYAMASDFRNRAVPIDGVGLQMHLTRGGIDGESLADNMRRFGALGLEVYITEMDVRYAPPISSADQGAQAAIYRTVLERCLAEPACKGFQTWGFTDRYSWIPSAFPGQGDALLFDAAYQPKPAYDALVAALGGPPREAPAPLAPEGCR